MGAQQAADAPTTYGVAVGLHFRPQPAGAVALAVVGKSFAHGHLPRRSDHWLLPAVTLGVIRSRGHAQRLAELAYVHLGGALGNIC
ncbi:hypothetical protein LGH70_22690 [Hymenobacter sp. BT635]|uniref:Uncharacterized protein n=1 Tax=Hymenobacter nitidus TaxID=2880929 RepID=A0ABS8AJ12_9BACT|nr:hypothetical protein [Hymenobacter nitidus]MCB2380418.1 hypothetical protein [Hymenobacter nitidus]